MGVGDAETNKTVKLYLRLPFKIENEEQVRDLHPGIVKVILPRQKHRRWCVVEFDNADAETAVRQLKGVTVNGKKVSVSVQKNEGGGKKRKVSAVTKQ